MDTLDIKGLPKDKVHYLQQLIKQWRMEQEAAQAPPANALKPILKRKVDPSEFLVVKSQVIGGEVTRAMAYDE